MRILIDKKETLLPCSFCDCKCLYQYARVEDAPGFLGCSEKDRSSDVFLSFQIYICTGCELIQSDAEPTDAIYSEMHSEALGSIWAAHHERFAEFIQASFNPPDWSDLTILEIGASVQPIARKLSRSVKKIFYIDPIHTPPFELNKNETYISGFFPQVTPATSVDLVIASHVLEHVPNAKQFILSLSESLNRDGKIFVSIPQFKTWLQSHYFNAISPEHVNYPFDEQMRRLASFAKLSIEMELYKEHSLFASFCSLGDSFPTGKVSFERSIAVLDDWIAAFNQMVCLSPERVNHLFKSNRSCFVAGASHLAQYFLLCNEGLSSHLTAVLDNANKKRGRRLYGTDLRADSFDVLKGHAAPIIFLPPSPYAAEMKSQILRINPLSEILEI